jgi:hypothetical protein
VYLQDLWENSLWSVAVRDPQVLSALTNVAGQFATTACVMQIGYDGHQISWGKDAQDLGVGYLSGGGFNLDMKTIVLTNMFTAALNVGVYHLVDEYGNVAVT